MATYGIFLKDKLIAIHDDEEIAERFVSQQQDHTSFTIVKIKNKQMKKIRKVVDVEELYLVRYGNEYVPFEYYATLKAETKQSVEDHQYCIDILYRILEERELTKKESRAVLDTISIIMDMTEEPSGLSVDALRSLKELNEKYREKVLTT